VKQVVQHILEHGGEYEVDYRITRPDGSIRWIATHGSVELDERGKPVLARGVSRDVTERKIAEEELRESEARFRTVANAAPVMIWMSGPDKLCTFFNKGWLDFTGRSPEQELGNGWAEGVHREDIDRCLDVYQNSFNARESFTMEYRLRRSDGEYRWLLDSGTPRFASDGAFLGYIGSCIDITERKAAEVEARQRREQVELLGRVSLLGEMAASLAHELDQPLAAIVSNATAAMRYLEQGKLDPEQLQEILTDVVGDGRRAHDIMHNVRSAIKKGSAIRGRINLNDVVKAVTHMVHLDAAAHFCKVEMSLARNLPAIDGDPSQIQQVLINLVRNAFDAMRDTPPSGRKVEIATTYNGDGTICVAVRDYGSGIPEPTLERLFEQFFTTKEEGLGMGLAIVRSIVEAHGGSIAAENADGGGARFHFRLPTKDGMPQL
jgi:PAS domain S-box-containing protein